MANDPSTRVCPPEKGIRISVAPSGTSVCRAMRWTNEPQSSMPPAPLNQSPPLHRYPPASTSELAAAQPGPLDPHRGPRHKSTPAFSELQLLPKADLFAVRFRARPGGVGSGRGVPIGGAGYVIPDQISLCSIKQSLDDGGILPQVGPGPRTIRPACGGICIGFGRRGIPPARTPPGSSHARFAALRRIPRGKDGSRATRRTAAAAMARGIRLGGCVEESHINADSQTMAGQPQGRCSLVRGRRSLAVHGWSDVVGRSSCVDNGAPACDSFPLGALPIPLLQRVQPSGGPL